MEKIKIEIEKERLIDTLTFLNRVQLGNGNVIGEAKTFVEIVSLFENHLNNFEEKQKEVKKEIDKKEIEK